MNEYTARHYHQPPDEFQKDFDYRGAIQQGQVIFLAAHRVANAATRPEWHPTSEFQRRR